MSYPGSLDNVSTVSTGQLITSTYMNSLANAVNNTQSALDVNPARHLNEGRLTLVTGTPVPMADQTAKSIVYFTPFKGNRIGIYDGSSAWSVHALSADLSLSLSGLTSGSIYDLFVYDNSGTVTLSHGTAWASASARVSGAAGEIVLQDGIFVNKYADGSIPAKAGRLVGTIRATSATTTEDSAANRFVFNLYNQVPRHLLAQNTSNQTSTATSFTAIANTTAAFLIGFQAGSFHLSAITGGASNSGAAGSTSAIGVGLAGSTPSAQAAASADAPVTGYNFAFNSPMLVGYPALGYNYADAYAETASTTTLTMIDPGLVGMVEM